jgi:hypothetical protein
VSWGGLLAAAVSLATASSQSVAAAAPPTGDIVRVAGPSVAGSYVVIFTDSVAADAVPAKAAQLAGRFGGRTGHTFQHTVRGFEVSMSEAGPSRLATDPSVAYVQENAIHRTAGTQHVVPSWGLDRIDQRMLPLSTSYTFPSELRWVSQAYIIDSGIRFSHNEFGGRARSGVDMVDGGSADDANGHGTHVAAIVGGSTVGVAKNSRLTGVRVGTVSSLGLGMMAGTSPSMAVLPTGGVADRVPRQHRRAVDSRPDRHPGRTRRRSPGAPDDAGNRPGVQPEHHRSAGRAMAGGVRGQFRLPVDAIVVRRGGGPETRDVRVLLIQPGPTPCAASGARSRAFTGGSQPGRVRPRVQ